MAKYSTKFLSVQYGPFSVLTPTSFVNEYKKDWLLLGLVDEKVGDPE
jgi:hypothetical protein